MYPLLDRVIQAAHRFSAEGSAGVFEPCRRVDVRPLRGQILVEVIPMRAQHRAAVPIVIVQECRQLRWRMPPLHLLRQSVSLAVATHFFALSLKLDLIQVEHQSTRTCMFKRLQYHGDFSSRSRHHHVHLLQFRPERIVPDDDFSFDVRLCRDFCQHGHECGAGPLLRRLPRGIVLGAVVCFVAPDVDVSVPQIQSNSWVGW